MVTPTEPSPAEGADGEGAAAVPDLAELGRRLRLLRALRGLSLEGAGKLLDCSPSFLSMLERGQTDVALGRFNRICAAYGVHPGELLLEHAPAAAPLIQRIDEAPTIDRGAGSSTACCAASTRR